MVIPREAGRTTYSTEIRALKKRLVLDDNQKAIVIGTILGDGCLCDNWSKTNYRLKMSHSIKQREYVLWKYGILRDWILTEPKVYEKTKSITIRTISHPELTDLHGIFYRDKKKIIPKNIQDLLNPLTMAVWFMDDGNIIRDKSRFCGYHMNTQSFTFKENERLAEILNSEFKILCTVQKNHGKHRLHIGSRSRNQFTDLICDYVLPSLQYKLG